MSKELLRTMVEKLIAESKEQQAAKRKAPKLKSINPHRVQSVVKNSNGNGYRVITEDTRLSDPHWLDQCRVLLIREVKCNQCGLIQEAPNERLMVRKTHPRHGIIEEALGIHEAQYDHLPLRVERIRSPIHLCQHCITYEQTLGNDTSHCAQQSFAFVMPGTINLGTRDSDDDSVGPEIEETEETPLDLFDIAENQSALEDF